MDLGGIDTRKYFTVIWLFLALLFTVLGPEGSTDASLLLSFLQWLLQVGIPLALLIASQLLLSRWSTFDQLNPWLKLTISGVIGGVLFAPFALALDFVLGVDTWRGFGNTVEILRLLGGEVAAVVPPVVLVWLGINAPRVLRLDFSRSDQASAALRPGPIEETKPAESDANVSESGFMAQVPPEIGQDIVYLKAELHYLRVVTTKGRALVLYNLRDAINEMPEGSGIQTHRSYWVAFGHIDRQMGQVSRVCLQMDDGSEVPVSRRQSSRVKYEILRLNI